MPRQTTLLIPSLHCPSCASFVEAFLFCLRPKPISVSTSILSHTVTVKHDALLAVSTIAKALDEAGYDVHAVIPDPASGDASTQTDSRNAPGHGVRLEWLQRAVQKWDPSKRDTADEETRRMRHIEHCDQCRAQGREDAMPSLRTIITEKGSQVASNDPSQDVGSPFVVVHSTTTPTKVFQASLSISGMSCSSCVGKITRSLEEQPWVRSANVALLTQNASVQFDGVEHAEELVKIIDGVGFSLVRSISTCLSA